MISTAELKLELTEKMDRAVAKGGYKARNVPMKSSSASQQPYPAGVKCHMYADVIKNREADTKNHWNNIYQLLGSKAGSNQN